jgi:hypothetical protein
MPQLDIDFLFGQRAVLRLKRIAKFMEKLAVLFISLIKPSSELIFMNKMAAKTLSFSGSLLQAPVKGLE